MNNKENSQEGIGENILKNGSKSSLYAERISDIFDNSIGKSYCLPDPMKGVDWDGSAIATKGTTKSESHSMFSVGNLIAFETLSYCPPDGRNSRSGVDLLTANYKLQDEIDLKEYDNTNVNKYGSGSYDIQKVITLNSVFLHEKYGKGVSYYLTGIFKDNKSRLDEKLCKGIRIEEIRNNPGLYLHVYSIGSFDADIAKNEKNIDDAIKQIKNTHAKNETLMNELEGKAKEKREKLKVNFTKEGIEYAKLFAERVYGNDTHWSDSFKNSKLSGFDKLLDNIDGLNKGEVFAMMYESGYYSKSSSHQITSDLDIGVPSLGTDDNFGCAVRDGNILIYKITKKQKTKNGMYCGSFFLDDDIIDVFQSDDGTLTEQFAIIKKGSKSVYPYINRHEITGEEGMMKEYNDKSKEIKERNKNKFNELAKKVESLYSTDVLNLVKKHKGRILDILENLTKDDLSTKLSNKKDVLKKALQVSINSYRDTVLTLISLIAYNPSSMKIKKVFGNEFDSSTSWAHYNNILGGIPIVGGMHYVSEAYSIYYKLKTQEINIENKDELRKLLQSKFGNHNVK